jgi:prephenate dehydratase
MQDSGNDNVTIFIVIAKEPKDVDPEIAPINTALLFTIRNIPGSLYKALGGFATNNVSIVKLESYIPGGVSKQAQFFISIEGHPNQKKVAQSLEELGFFSKSVKLLGVYYADKSRFEN